MTEKKNPRTCTPDAATDFILTECRNRGDVISNLKLQKLLYYADAWSLALYDQEIFPEKFQAWVHGPVLPSQYARFKDYGWRPITEDVVPPRLNDSLEAHFMEIIDVFGSETAVALELMTHREPPWLAARGDLPPTAPSNNYISKDITKAYYRSLQECP